MVEPRHAIEPGSTEFGDRQTLEQGLQAGGGAPTAPPSAPTGTPGVTIPEDPLGALTSGEVKGQADGMITDGLSVGAGTGPPNAPAQMLGDRATRLRQLAMEASSPYVRAAARQELRRMTTEPI